MDIFNRSLSANGSGGGDVPSAGHLPESPYSTLEVVVIVLVAGPLSLVTVIGNILVMLSIKVNRNLQTVNNYFLFSLACADLIIGLCSMNLYTVYIVIGYWPLGAVVCDLWLAVDYVVSNASVMNLLIISFDRYFCVTKPLSCPMRRSTKMAGLMIAAAWVLSFVLWAPAILFWQFVVGMRTVPPGECYIQFFSNATVTFGTAIAAFYLPVAIMMVLYWRISKASRCRVKREGRKTSRTSLRDGPSQSQEEGDEGQRGSGGEPGRAQGGAARDGEAGRRASRGQPNGRVERAGSTGERTVVGDVAPAPRQEEEEGGASAMPALSEGRSSREGKQRRTPRASQGGAEGSAFRSPAQAGSKSRARTCSAAERQNLVSRTLLKAAKRSLVLKALNRGASSRERKVTRTIMAILVAFVATWTPYNVMVLINTFCSTCIPSSLWTIGYWLCYINSTVNPACYALCNATFKNTFKHLLLCQYKKLQRSSAR